jgi:hypothetical protein
MMIKIKNITFYPIDFNHSHELIKIFIKKSLEIPCQIN